MNAHQQVERWLKEAVIGLELCPFAKQPYLKQQIAICIAKVRNIEELMLLLADQCIQLQETSRETLETTLIVIPDMLDDFEDFLDCLFLAEQVIESQGWQGIFQIASFHPQYQFEGTKKDDVENLTNQSPYPIFHILREQSICHAIDSYGDTSVIPERNKQRIQRLSPERRQEIFSHLK